MVNRASLSFVPTLPLTDSEFLQQLLFIDRAGMLFMRAKTSCARWEESNTILIFKSRHYSA
jgi:hypothetical protein